jgi:hypothetical protein
MPALRVPCDARMSRRDAELAALRQTHPETPGPSCASRRASTGGGVEDLGRRTKTNTKELSLPSFRHGSSRNPNIYDFWIPACAGMTGTMLRAISPQ